MGEDEAKLTDLNRRIKESIQIPAVSSHQSDE